MRRNAHISKDKRVKARKYTCMILLMNAQTHVCIVSKPDAHFPKGKCAKARKYACMIILVNAQTHVYPCFANLAKM